MFILPITHILHTWNKEIKDIEKITKDWLKNNQLPSKRVIFEKGNVDLPIGTNKNVYKTRFYYAKTRKIKYFVEDEPAKAIKLSQICRYVFLVDHIYNQLNNLPYNIIRVKNWSEIYDYLKEFE